MNQKKIGMFISECRKEKKLTQEKLADILGVSNRTISKWENGNCMPDYSILPILCKTLDITINELLSGEKLNDEEYQQKLEENIILNMAELKKRTKKITSIIIKIIILCILLILTTEILETVVNKYNYKRQYLKDNEFSIKLCSEDNQIRISIEAKDNKPIWIETILNMKKKEYSYIPYRIRKKKYMENDSVQYLMSINKKDLLENYSIKIGNKIVYKQGMIVEKCIN